MKLKAEIIMAGVFLIAPLGRPMPVDALPPRPTEIPFSIHVDNLLPDLAIPEYPKPARLSSIGFQFDPIGTHPNQYPPGQCTYGAASMKGNISWNGNANEWDDQARARGITVSDVPIVGAVAQTDRGSDGHVAVVTAVYSDHIIITEMNFDYNGGVRSRPAATSEFNYIYL